MQRVDGTVRASRSGLVIDLVGVHGSPFALPRRQNYLVADDIRDKVVKILHREALIAPDEGRDIPWWYSVEITVHVVPGLVRGVWTVAVREAG